MNVIDQLKKLDFRLASMESRLGEVRRRVAPTNGGNGGAGAAPVFHDDFYDAEIYCP